MPFNTLRSKSLNEVYLSTLSPKDKSWDKHKSDSTKVEGLYQGTVYDRYAGRMAECSGHLGFKWTLEETSGELKLKLNSAHFCRVRHCPICQWRKSLMWMARFLEKLPTIVKDYPKHRYIFLTLTVKNCDILELRQTLSQMNAAWQRMVQRKSFPAVGFVKSTEVTKSADGLAHPHFHAILMVDPGYFAGKNYLKQAQWAEMWRSCLRVEYTPVVNVKSVKNTPRKRATPTNEESIRLDGSDASQAILDATDAISRGIVEVCKYATKPEDVIGTESPSDREWLINLTNQLYKTRSISLGGIFKNYLSEEEPEDLIGNDNSDENKVTDITFGWREKLARYTALKDK